MEKELFIVYSNSDQAHIESLREPLEAKGYKLTTQEISSDPDSWDAVRDADFVALWLTPNSPECIYQFAGIRQNVGKKTINIFAQPLYLAPRLRKIVGQNESIFAEMHPSGIVPTLSSILNKMPSRTPGNVATTSNTYEESAMPSTAVYDRTEPSQEEKKSIPWKTIIWVVVGLLLLGILFG